MLRKLCAALAASVILTGCASEPELVGNPPLPDPPGSAAGAAGGRSNGIADLPAAQAPGKIYNAVISAGAMRVTGEDPADDVRLDARYSTDRAMGTLWMDAVRVDFRRVGSALYVKSTRAYWAQTPLAASAGTLGSSWVRITKDDGRAGVVVLFGALDVMAGRMIDPGGPYTWSGRKVVRGLDTVGLVSGARRAPTLWVATAGPPYPVLLAGGEDRLSMELADFGRTVRTSAPPGAIDGDRLAMR